MVKVLLFSFLTKLEKNSRSNSNRNLGLCGKISEQIGFVEILNSDDVDNPPGNKLRIVEWSFREGG